MRRGLHLCKDTQIGVPRHVLRPVVRIICSALPHRAGRTAQLAVVGWLNAHKSGQMTHTHYPYEG